MHSPGRPEWLIREDAGRPVLLALFLRQRLGLRSPAELPALRDVPVAASDRPDAQQAVLEHQWREYWAMTVEPQAHPAAGPLELVEGFATMVALPLGGADQLRAEIAPHAADAVAYATEAHHAYAARTSDVPADAGYRAYASAIAEHERQVGRPAHSFELNVQVLPLTQRGLWWIGSLTIAVTDGLRRDVAAFDTAIHPVIADLA